jgi:hypothetical protein
MLIPKDIEDEAFFSCESVTISGKPAFKNRLEPLDKNVIKTLKNLLLKP